MTTHVHLPGNGATGPDARTAGGDLLMPEVEGLSWNRGDELIDQVSARNDELARVPAGDTARFGLLPFPLLEPSLREAQRVLDELGFEGVCLMPIVGDRTLDEPEFAPLLEDLDRRGARLLLHPIDASGDPLENPRYLDAMLSFARLLYFDRMRLIPRVRVTLAHTGGVETFLAENIGMLHYLQAKRWRMGAFFVDYLIRKRLRGFELVRAVDCCG